MNEQTQQVETPRSGSATRGQVEAFCRAMLARSVHAFECWLCGGKRRVKAANGTSASVKCAECNGTGQGIEAQS